MGAGVGELAGARVPAFRLLWLSGVFSFMSIQMQFLLRSLLAWDLTESEGALGIVMFSFGAALGISTLFGGVAADRLSKRRLMLFGQMVLLRLQLRRLSACACRGRLRPRRPAGRLHRRSFLHRRRRRVHRARLACRLAERRLDHDRPGLRLRRLGHGPRLDPEL
ncbi:hypothetical protein [Candidatus Poriferisodalis sp.]|uniref:hypothetical protein n=1 Tax=Candidatus Poriferisodalis sp. TaxID=3101277 RepID=UPI003B0203CB